MFVIAIYIAIGKPTLRQTSTIDPGGRAAIAFFYIWTIAYSISWNGTPWLIAAEAFPGSVRTVAQTFAACSNWLWNL